MSTSPIPAAAAEPTDAPLFRPSKKRKIYRQRATEDDEPAPPSTLSPPPQTASFSIAAPAPLPTAQSLDELISTAGATSPHDDDPETQNVSMAEILRLRKKNKSRGGVEFKASGHVARDEEGELILRAEDERGVESAGVSGVPRKFAPQTGTVGDVNRHM